MHPGPKRGRGPNIAEIELSAPCGSCLNRRPPSVAGMRSEIAGWGADLNHRQTPGSWHLKTQDARVKLKSLNPNTLEVMWF